MISGEITDAGHCVVQFDSLRVDVRQQSSVIWDLDTRPPVPRPPDRRGLTIGCHVNIDDWTDMLAFSFSDAPIDGPPELGSYAIGEPWPNTDVRGHVEASANVKTIIRPRHIWVGVQGNIDIVGYTKDGEVIAKFNFRAVEYGPTL